MNNFIPKYVKAKRRGWLSKKIKQAMALLTSCTLCPRQCRKNRKKGEKGFCSTGKKAVVSSFAPHFGEEPQLVGKNGSGTIFFSNCNLKCEFCQNYDISINGAGQIADDGQIASIMLHLQKIGCHNINLVTPSHVVPQILTALNIAIDHGLNIPLVYNCSGYESLKTLRVLNDIIDIYMPDFKFWNSEFSNICCHVNDYPNITKKAIKEMNNQVGDLKMDKNGIACSGLLVRHLVMPETLEDTYHILEFLKKDISAFVHINVMSQYHPMGNAYKIKNLSKPLTPEEFRKALQMAKDLDLKIIQ